MESTWEEHDERDRGDEEERPERRRLWLRGSVSAASLLLLLASVALFAAEHHADGGQSAGLHWTALAAGATQQLADLTFYEKLMQRLATLNSNLTGATNATDCPEGEECIPADAVRVSAFQIANNLAEDWLVRTSAKDQHPYQFCAMYTDLSANEMRACVRHLMRPLELAREETIGHNNTNALVLLALQNNVTFNVSDENGWDACYEAWQDQRDKDTCVTFVSNMLEGDLAFACTKLDSPEELLKCRQVKQAVHNIKSLILRQKVMPVSDALNSTIMKQHDQEQAFREMQESENRTEEALQTMNPELEKMFTKTIQISAESNEKLTAMEQAINDTFLSGPQTVIDRLGPEPGPFGELPGKLEHEYLVNRTLAAKRSAVAEEVAAAAANSSVEATKIIMRAIISRKYNGAGDADRALQLMNSSFSSSGNMAAEVVKESGEQAGLHGMPTQLGAAAYTSSLLQVGGGMKGGRSVAARVQGLVQLEKLAEHGNLGDLDSIMDSDVQWQHAGVTPEERAAAKVAIAFGDDGFDVRRHRERESDLHLGSGLNSALDGFSHLLLSHKGPALHVVPSSEFKSAADLASQFNADSVPTLLNFADDGTGSEALDNNDLTSVMEGNFPAPHVPPPRALVDKEIIAKEFKDDDVGKLASSRAEQQDQGTGWIQRFYKNLKAEDNANRDLRVSRQATAPRVSGAIRATAPRAVGAAEVNVSPRAVAQVEETKRRGKRQHAPATATKGSKPFDPYGYTHAQEDQVAKEEVVSMKSLWNKLLKEEAMATAAKLHAHVAKEQAILAALKIREQEKAKAHGAVQQEEVKLRRDEDKVLHDRWKAQAAKKQADLLAHKLAEDKFAEMQESKRAAKAFKRRKVAAQKFEQQAQRAEFQNAQAAMMEQAREDAAKTQQHQPHDVRVQAATQQAARRKTLAHIASPPVKKPEASTPSNHPVLSLGTGQSEASNDTDSGGIEDGKIVATVKRLEDKAEREPVVTRRERQEQRAEVMEAEKLLHQAAWLREHEAHQDAPPAQIHARASRPAARSPDAAVSVVEPSQHGGIWNGVISDVVVASPSQAARAVAQHRQDHTPNIESIAKATGKDRSTSGARVVISSKNQARTSAEISSDEAPPAQAVAQSAPSASDSGSRTQATATSIMQRSKVEEMKVQGIQREREQPQEQDDEPPETRQLPPQVAVAGVAAAAPVVPAPAPAKPSALSPTQIMDAKIRKENEAEEAEEARVKGLVNALTAGDNIDADNDGLGDLLSGTHSVMQDDRKIQTLRNDDMSAAGIIAAVPVQAEKSDDGSNLGDLLNLMNTPPQSASSIKPYQLGSHLYSAQDNLVEHVTQDDSGKAGGTITDVAAEARKIHEMNARRDAQIAHMPGAHAMERLAKVDAELAAHKDGLQKHLALEAKYKAQAEQSRKNLEKLEMDNSGMFGLLGVLQDAGSAGGALSNLLASGLEAARKPTIPLPNVAKAFSKVWKAHEAPRAR